MNRHIANDEELEQEPNSSELDLSPHNHEKPLSLHTQGSQSSSQLMTQNNRLPALAPRGACPEREARPRAAVGTSEDGSGTCIDLAEIRRKLAHFSQHRFWMPQLLGDAPADAAIAQPIFANAERLRAHSKELNRQSDELVQLTRTVLAETHKLLGTDSSKTK